MPKNKSNKRKQQGAAWSAADHAERQEQKQSKQQKKDPTPKSKQQQVRTALLSHDTFDKRQQLKLKLHFTKTNRKIEQLKSRLEQWDPIIEAQMQRKEEEEEQQKQEQLLREEQEGKKKKQWRRPGPETWQLKGAARPAHLVYDFDTRYQCPHQKAHEDYKAKQSRLKNFLQVPFPSTANEDRAASVLRDYLSTLMQCGHLQVEMGASPISYWQECMALEQLHSLHLTTAQRDSLQWYMEQGDYDQAEQFLQNNNHATDETDVWWIFSSAWLAVELKRTNVSERMTCAIRNNPFCAYYLAFYETFDGVFEYQNELQEADDIPQSSLEEAIEFCSTGAGEMWRTNGADQILQRILLEALQRPPQDVATGGLTWKDLEWKSRLEKMELAYEKQKDEDSDDEEGPDISMYAEMFRTSMDMLEQAGKIPKLS